MIKKSSSIVEQVNLFQAIKNGDIFAVAKLLQVHEIDPNAADTDGVTPLLQAVWCDQSWIYRKEIVELLLPRLTPEQINVQEKRDGLCAFLAAANLGRTEIFQILLSRLAPDHIDIKDTLAESSALQLAAYQGSLEIIKLLLPHLTQEQIDYKNSMGATALSWAAEQEHIHVVLQLLRSNAHFEVEAYGVIGLSIVLLGAVIMGETELVRQILDVGANPIQQHFHTYCEYADEDVDLNLPLWFAAFHGYTDIAKMIIERTDTQHLNLRFNERGDNNCSSCSRKCGVCMWLEHWYRDMEHDIGALQDTTPLFVAALNGHKEMVKLLLPYLSIQEIQTSHDDDDCGEYTCDEFFNKDAFDVAATDEIRQLILDRINELQIGKAR